MNSVASLRKNQTLCHLGFVTHSLSYILSPFSIECWLATYPCSSHPKKEERGNSRLAQVGAQYAAERISAEMNIFKKAERAGVEREGREEGEEWEKRG